MQLSERQATLDDLDKIINLLIEDELGQKREQLDESTKQNYIRAFELIDNDPNQYLMVVSDDHEIIATCHLTLMPSLTYMGSKRMQIEAVRVQAKYRGQKIGEWMMQQAIKYAEVNNEKIILLTTNKQRQAAQRFYINLGITDSHEGMKLFL